MIGDTLEIEGELFEVVWNGGEGLIGDRETKSAGLWETPPPNRLYNKTGNHTKKNKKEPTDG